MSDLKITSERIQSELLKMVVDVERMRIWKYLEYYGIPDPITDSKGLPCEHNVYRWEICEQCSLEQLYTVIFPVDTKEV